MPHLVCLRIIIFAFLLDKFFYKSMGSTIIQIDHFQSLNSFSVRTISVLFEFSFINRCKIRCAQVVTGNVTNPCGPCVLSLFFSHSIRDSYMCAVAT